MNLVVGVYGPDLGVRWLNWECVEWGSISTTSRRNRAGGHWSQNFIYKNRDSTSSYMVLSRKFEFEFTSVSSSPSFTMSTSFSAAHRSHVKSLYRRMLKNELDWVVRRDIWRGRAMVIRAEFERNR